MVNSPARINPPVQKAAQSIYSVKQIVKGEVVYTPASSSLRLDGVVQVSHRNRTHTDIVYSGLLVNYYTSADDHYQEHYQEGMTIVLVKVVPPKSTCHCAYSIVS